LQRNFARRISTIKLGGRKLKLAWQS